MVLNDLLPFLQELILFFKFSFSLRLLYFEDYIERILKKTFIVFANYSKVLFFITG